MCEELNSLCVYSRNRKVYLRVCNDLSSSCVVRWFPVIGRRRKEFAGVVKIRPSVCVREMSYDQVDAKLSDLLVGFVVAFVVFSVCAGFIILVLSCRKNGQH